ncbi:unnamed protein product [Lathyrus oleraceus]
MSIRSDLESKPSGFGSLISNLHSGCYGLKMKSGKTYLPEQFRRFFMLAEAKQRSSKVCNSSRLLQDPLVRLGLKLD